MKGDNELAARPEQPIYSLLSGLQMMRSSLTGKEIGAIGRAIAHLRQTRLPKAYVDGIQDELLEMVASRMATTIVYLAYHGEGERAAFVKVGIAGDIKARMRQIYTGNPLPRLWTFAAAFPSRAAARSVESALHLHLSSESSSGEWFRVHGMALDAATTFSESLAEVASNVVGTTVSFARE